MGLGKLWKRWQRQGMERYLSRTADHVQRHDLDRLSADERVFRAVWELEAEVNNGGFSQYFLNSSGKMAGEVAAALRTIRAHKTANIVEEAVAVVGKDTPWVDGDARWQIVADLSDVNLERLNALDEQFYAYPDDLTELLHQWLKARGI